MKSNSTKYELKKHYLSFFIFLSFIFLAATVNGQVAINNDNSNPNASAMLDVKATGLGFLAPRMTLANRPASPATGLLIYQTDNNPGYYYYDGATWQKIGQASNHYWALNGINLYNTSGSNIGIGTNDAQGHGVYVPHYSTGTAAVRGTDESSGFIYADGQLGVLNWPSNPLALPIDVANIGVLGFKPNSGVEGAGIYGYSADADANNYAGIFATQGVNTGINYGIYTDADSASTNYAGYFKGRVHIKGNGITDAAADSAQTLLYSEVSLQGSFNDTRAIEGYSHSRPGYGYGVYGSGGYKGVQGVTVYDDYTGTSYGVYGYASGSAGTRVGVYGFASGGTTNWAAYFSGSAYVSSDLRIATTAAATGYALSVNGKIACEEVLVQDATSWPDYVFDHNYDLMSLDEVENHIIENKHLPGIPPAAEVEENGFNISDMQKRVLEKVEELTLYTIQQGKMIKELQEKVKALKAENEALKKD